MGHHFYIPMSEKKSGFLQEHLLPRMCLLENKIHVHRCQNG